MLNYGILGAHAEELQHLVTQGIPAGYDGHL